MENSNDENHKTKFNLFRFVCKQCELTLHTHMEFIHHNMLHLYGKYNLKNVDAVEFNANEKNIKCLLCNEIFRKDEEFTKHMKAEIHTGCENLLSSLKDDLKIESDSFNLLPSYKKLVKSSIKTKDEYIYFCNVCMTSVDINCLSDHVNGKKHKKNLLLFSKNSELTSCEHIQDLSVSYVCYVCNKYYPSKFNLFSHYDTREHRSRINCFHYVFKNSCIKISHINQMYLMECHICKVNNDSIVAAFNHLSSEHHLKNVAQDKFQKEKTTSSMSKKLDSTNSLLNAGNNKLLNSVTVLSKINNAPHNSIKYIKLESNESNQNSEERFLEENNISYNPAAKFYKCNICELWISDLENVYFHIKKQTHQNKKEEARCNLQLEILKIINEANLKKTVISEIRYCKQCNVSLNSLKQIICHNMVHLYQDIDLRNIDILVYNYSRSKNIECLLCKEILASDQVLMKHLESKGHINRVNLFSGIRSDIKVYNVAHNNLPSYKDLLKNKSLNSNELVSCYYCNVCSMTLQYRFISKHLNQKKHIDKLMVHPENQELKNNNYIERKDLCEFFMCFICHKYYHSKKHLFLHFDTKRHRYKIQCFYRIFNCPHIRFIHVNKKELLECTHCFSIAYTVEEAFEHLPFCRKTLQNQMSNSSKEIVKDLKNVPKKNIEPKELAASHEIKQDHETILKENVSTQEFTITITSKAISENPDTIIKDKQTTVQETSSCYKNSDCTKILIKQNSNCKCNDLNDEIKVSDKQENNVNEKFHNCKSTLITQDSHCKTNNSNKYEEKASEQIFSRIPETKNTDKQELLASELQKQLENEKQDENEKKIQDSQKMQVLNDFKFLQNLCNNYKEKCKNCDEILKKQVIKNNTVNDNGKENVTSKELKKSCKACQVESKSCSDCKKQAKTSLAEVENVNMKNNLLINETNNAESIIDKMQSNNASENECSPADLLLKSILNVKTRDSCQNFENFSIENVNKNSEEACSSDSESDCLECQVAALEKDKNCKKNCCIYSYNLSLTQNDYELLDRNDIIYDPKARFYKCLICVCWISNFEEVVFHVTKTSHEINKYKKLGTCYNENKKRTCKQQVMKTKKNQATEKFRKFSLGHSLHNFEDSYVSMCLERGKEDIYGMDSSNLEYFNSSLKFIFAYESVAACILCCQKLPSSNIQIIHEHLYQDDHITFLQELQNESKKLQQLPNQISALEMALSYMIQESDKSFKCFACNSSISNQPSALKKHYTSVQHVKNFRITKGMSKKLHENFKIPGLFWLHADKFHCDICEKKAKSEIDFAKHLTHPDHKANEMIARQVSEPTGCYLCLVCAEYWYGKSDSFNIHCENSSHKLRVKNNETCVPPMSSLAQELLQNVNEKISKLVETSNDCTLHDKESEFNIVESIEKTGKILYPNAKAYVFGSRISFLAFPDSDVDIFLDCGNFYYKQESRSKSLELLESLVYYFENQTDTWIVDEVLSWTRVPIIRMTHIPTQLSCDISFINGLGVEKSKLLRIYNIAFPICRTMTLYLKKWFSENSLLGSNRINSFAVSWLLVFYLQFKNLIPCVYELLETNKCRKIVDYWDCSFSENVTVNSLNIPIDELLRGFFLYYAEFDYRTHFICPLLGKVFKKRIFVFLDYLPKEMNLYKQYLKSKEPETFRIDSPLCIQDPIELSQNITKAVRKSSLRIFREYCKESAIKMTP